MNKNYLSVLVILAIILIPILIILNIAFNSEISISNSGIAKDFTNQMAWKQSLVNSIQSVDLVWEEGPPLVIGDIGHAQVYNGKIYFVGGSAVQEYDPDRGNWTIINSEGLGYQPYRGGSALIGDRIYIITGWMETTIYDIGNNTFSKFKTSKIGRLDVAVGAVNGILYVSGGWLSGDSTSITLVEAYNPENNTWNTVTSMNTSRKAHKMLALGDHLYVIGGYTGFGFSNITRKMERYDPQTNEWEYLTETPVDYKRCGSTTIKDDRIIISDIARTSIFDINEKTWVISTDPQENPDNSLVCINETIYSIGGTELSGNYHGFVWTLDLAKVKTSQDINGFGYFFTFFNLVCLAITIHLLRKRGKI